MKIIKKTREVCQPRGLQLINNMKTLFRIILLSLIHKITKKYLITHARIWPEQIHSGMASSNVINMLNMKI